MEDRRIGAIGIAIISLLIGGVIGWLIKPCPCEEELARLKSEVRASAIEVKIDTIEQVITQPPIVIHGKGRIVHTTSIVHDTVLRERDAPLAFVATLDTIVSNDTVGVRYEHPQALFSVMLRQAPDSIQLEYKTLTITNTVYEHRAWWIDALTHVGAATLGYGLGTINH